MKTKILIEKEIESCVECPMLWQHADSDQEGGDFRCRACENKIIAENVTRATQTPEVPNWCPLRMPEPKFKVGDKFWFGAIMQDGNIAAAESEVGIIQQEYRTIYVTTDGTFIENSMFKTKKEAENFINSLEGVKYEDIIKEK